jgi:hypothetical protein
MSSDVLRPHAEGCTLAVRVQPGAKKTVIAGIYGEGLAARLKIALQAPAIDGRANDALTAFLAEMFRLPKSSIQLLSGLSSRNKVLLLKGLDIAQAEAHLAGRGLTAGC